MQRVGIRHQLGDATDWMYKAVANVTRTRVHTGWQSEARSYWVAKRGAFILGGKARRVHTGWQSEARSHWVAKRGAFTLGGKPRQVQGKHGPKSVSIKAKRFQNIGSRTEEPAKADTCARDRRALQQLALNVHVKYSDLT